MVPLSEGSSVRESPEDKQASVPCVRGSTCTWGPIFSVKPLPVPGFSGGSEYSVTPAMDHWAVSNRVSTALSALQPLTAYSFTGVLGETTRHLGLSPPPGAEEQPADPPEPVSDPVREQMWATICSLLEAEQARRPSWFGSKGLHLDYSGDFTDRRSKDISPVLIPTLFDNIEAEVEQLKKLQPSVPQVGVPVAGVDKIWEEICDTPHQDRKAKFLAILQTHQQLPQPPPNNQPGAVPVNRGRVGLTPAGSKGSKVQPAPIGGGRPSGPPAGPATKPDQLADPNVQGLKRCRAKLGDPEVG